MKIETMKEDMVLAGASKEEIEQSIKLYELLKWCLKIKHNGRVETSGGDKTILGLYRMLEYKIYPNSTSC